MHATVLPSGSSQSVTWSSSNPAVATVDQNGVVTPHGYGSAKIKATANDGSGRYGTGDVSVLTPSYPISMEPTLLAGDGWVLGAGSGTDDFCVTIHYANGASMLLTEDDATTTITNSDEWDVAGEMLYAPDFTGNLELSLEYTENGHTVTYCSEGSVVRPNDFYSASSVFQIAKKYGDTSDAPAVIYDLACYSDYLTDLSGWLDFTASSPLLERTPTGFRLKAAATFNGDLHYSITGSLTDSFGNDFSKTMSFMSTIFEWRQRYYRVIIDTDVREHIDAGAGSQEQGEDIIVSVYLAKSWESDQFIARYFYPASYDSHGDLLDGYFSYYWYHTEIVQQMLDEKEYWFNYDRQGNNLLEGFCYEDGQYIYYKPLY